MSKPKIASVNDKMQRNYHYILNEPIGKNFNCRPRQRQALLHWAYDSRKL